jgi:hypothetical protein
MHDWRLSSAGGADVWAVAICASCGLMRTCRVTSDKHLDLRGDCPGQPPEPEKPAKRIPRRAVGF